MTDIVRFAEVVDEAARTATAIPQFTESAPLSVADAYAMSGAPAAAGGSRTCCPQAMRPRPFTMTESRHETGSVQPV